MLTRTAEGRYRSFTELMYLRTVCDWMHADLLHELKRARTCDQLNVVVHFDLARYILEVLVLPLYMYIIILCSVYMYLLRCNGYCRYECSMLGSHCSPCKRSSNHADAVFFFCCNCTAATVLTRPISFLTCCSSIMLIHVQE